MSWPLSHEFNEAVQNPRSVFADPDLKAGEVVVGATGLPLPRSGNFADVYQMRGDDGRDWAVKCFTRPVVGLAERYARVSDALARAGLPFAVGFEFLAEGIRVGGAWRPVVKMEWVEGLLLNQVARDSAGKPAVLAALGGMWGKLCKRLREAGIAHADIQHGNVLLVPGSRPGAYGLKLIDYDGVWVPALANTPSGEAGHPSFQHPARAATRAYSPDVDRFPHLAIATALRGLTVGGTALWERYDNGDNLLFTEVDYRAPAESKAMRELWHTDDPAVQALVGRLAVACGKPIPQTPWLDQLAPDGEPARLDAAARREAAAALGVALPVPVALPPEPTYAPPPPEAELAPQPFSFSAETEPEEAAVDVELVEVTRPAKAKRNPKRAAPAGNSRAPLLLIGGALLLMLLVGGVVAGVVLSGKKPPETVERPPDEPKPPVVKTPPKEKTPDPVLPPTPPVTPPNPIPGPPAVAPPPAGQLGVRRAWLTTFPVPLLARQPVCGRDGTSAALVDIRSRAQIIDLETGRPLPGQPADLDLAGLVRPLDGGLYASGVLRDKTLPVFDPRTGKVSLDLPTGGVVLPGRAYVSPAGAYLASSDETRFALKSVAADKVILDLKWEQGNVFFTADEKRVLVAEATGRCRWFDLPSGKPGADWTIEKKGPSPAAAFGIRAASDDGSVLVFWGTVSSAPLAVHMLDGATGRPLRTVIVDPRYGGDISMSRDGRFLMVKARRTDDSEFAKVIDLSTGNTIAVVPAPAGYAVFRPALLPDGRGCVAVLSEDNKSWAAARFDFSAVAGGPPPAPAKGGRKLALDFKPNAVKYLDANTLIAHDYQRTAVVVDVPTGAVTPLQPQVILNPQSVVDVPGDQTVGIWAVGAKEFFVYDTKTGKPAGTLPMPDFATPNPLFPATIQVSPDRQFVAFGVGYGAKFDPDTKQTTALPAPLRILDTKTKKTVLEREWYGITGGVVFTADSARVLVVDGYGRGQWFKLPSGAPDGEWNLGDKTTGPPPYRLYGASRDGRVVLGTGRVDGQSASFALDSETGKALQTFPTTMGYGRGLSADGKRALLMKSAGEDITLTVVDVETGAEVGRAQHAEPSKIPPAAALAPDGRTAVVFNRQTGDITVYDFGGGTGVAVGPKPTEPPAPVPAATPPPELKLRWSASISGYVNFQHVNEATKFIIVGSAFRDLAAFDLATGKQRSDVTPSRTTELAGLYQLERNRFASLMRDGDAISVWDERTAREVVKLPLPPSPLPRDVPPRVFLSPNAKYLVYTQHLPLGSTDDVPLRVYAAGTKRELFKIDWKGGSVHFTADSARMLVCEPAGRCRWYKLPSGEPGDNWELGATPPGRRHEVTGISDDGSVLGYVGPAGLPPGSKGPATLDGKTGKVLHSFELDNYHYAAPVAVSDDGRRVAVQRKDADATGNTYDVADARTGAVLGRATTGYGAAKMLLPGSGSTLVVIANQAKKLYVFDMPAAKGGKAP